jgi:hypothetical protein
MSTDITTLTHTLRKALATDIGLGHTHQLLAAALGFKSLAALQAAENEPSTFDSIVYWMVDNQQLELASHRLDCP